MDPKTQVQEDKEALNEVNKQTHAMKKLIYFLNNKKNKKNSEKKKTFDFTI